MQTAHENHSTAIGTLLTVSLELASKNWKLALQSDGQDKPSVHNASAEEPAMRFSEAMAVVDAIKRRWALAEPVRVAVVYEAGQDGFWIQRALQARGCEVYVVNPSSIPVERQARRAKTDRLDALKLLSCLRGWLRGERDRMRPVHAPSARAEGLRHLARERGQLQKEVGQHRDRIRKLLRTVGCWTTVDNKFEERLKNGEIRCYDGSPLSPWLRQRLANECTRLALVAAQLKALEESATKQLPPDVANDMNRLQQLRGIGAVGAFRLMLELFWRTFDNRRQIGACLGLVPQPYDSGQSRVDQGISKQSNNRIRALSVEMAWMWVRHQPKSELTQWFLKRTGTDGTPGKGKRGRRIAIVAVARRLMIELWRYIQDGVVPKGSEIKPAVRRA